MAGFLRINFTLASYAFLCPTLSAWFANLNISLKIVPELFIHITKIILEVEQVFQTQILECQFYKRLPLSDKLPSITLIYPYQALDFRITFLSYSTAGSWDDVTLCLASSKIALAGYFLHRKVFLCSCAEFNVSAIFVY